jgi:hypothetical protein
VRFGVDSSDRGLRIIVEQESEALRLLAGVTDDPGLDLGPISCPWTGAANNSSGKPSRSITKAMGVMRTSIT